MGRQKTNCKNQSGFFNSKSATIYLAALLSACSTSPEKTYIDSVEGEIHQITQGSPTDEASFSALHKKIIYTKDFQIFEMDLSTQKEKRITYNLGKNHSPKYHPFKNWIVYSSTSDETIEKMNVAPLMRDLGISANDNKDVVDASSEIYLSTDRGTEIKRITHNKGFDDWPVFSSDGNKIYYVSQFTSGSQILIYDVNNIQRVYWTDADPIVGLTLNQDLIAWVTKKADLYKLIIKNLKNGKILFEHSDKIPIKHALLHSKEPKILFASQIEELGNDDIYLLDLEMKCLSRISHHAASEKFPSFGPDPLSYYFISDRTKSTQVFSATLKAGPACNPWPIPNKI